MTGNDRVGKSVQKSMMHVQSCYFAYSPWKGLQRERQTTTLHTFLYISLPFLHDYDVKMPNFVYGEHKQAKTKF